MERRLTEEQVTVAVMKWLIADGWNIVCYDFPQSGTGKVIHPNDAKSKNEGAIIPDIIATKDNIAVYFENKDRFVYDDFVKVDHIKTSKEYSNGLQELLQTDYIIRYGVAFPVSDKIMEIKQKHSEMVDFIITVDSEHSCLVSYDCYGIF